MIDRAAFAVFFSSLALNLAQAEKITLLCEVASRVVYRNGNVDLSPPEDSISASFSVEIDDAVVSKSIEIMRPYPENRNLFSDNACWDNEFNRSWMLIWKNNGNLGNGCRSYARFDNNFFVGGLILDPGFSGGTWSDYIYINIERRSGHFAYDYFSKTNNPASDFQISWRRLYSGSCDKTSKKF